MLKTTLFSCVSLVLLTVPVEAAKKKVVTEEQVEAMMDTIASVRKVSPIYPLHLITEGKTGFAIVEFTIDNTGHVMMPRVVEATEPEFGEALMADIEANEFLPPRFNGKAKSILTKQRYEFRGEAGLSDQEKMILAELKKPESWIFEADKLDAPLVAKFQPSPAYPFVADIEGISGEAVVEFFVDQTGRARFPKVVSASLKDFGWAAATAIARWKFQPPLKDGQKALVRTKVTVKFDVDSKKITW